MVNRWFLLCLVTLTVFASSFTAAQSVEEIPEFSIRFSDDLSSDAQEGRLLLMLATHDGSEPRFLVSNGLNTQLIFGRNVSDMSGGESFVIDSSHIGFPLADLSAVPPGTYYVQALLNRYEEFNLSNGKTVSLPPDRGEGQRWNRKPGNFYSEPVEIEISEAGINQFEIVMDQVIPEIEPPEDTEYIKHIKMRSELLSEFWGTDVYLGAHVLLPEGFDENPQARYPLMVFHGHFPSDFGGFRTEPPDPDLEPVYSARFDLDGYNLIEQQEAYDFYQTWISDDFPRFLIIEVQHPTPYYDDSYAVNSASQGPYGDAITYELIPYIEGAVQGHRRRLGQVHLWRFYRGLGSHGGADLLSR